MTGLIGALRTIRATIPERSDFAMQRLDSVAQSPVRCVQGRGQAGLGTLSPNCHR